MNPATSSEPLVESQDVPPRAHSATTLVVIGVCAVLVFAGLVALGTWQVQRLQWKLDLIERVEQRVHAPAVPAPGPSRWSQVTGQSHEYRHVRVEGTFLHDLSARVQATTELGSGFWLMTPLRQADDTLVLVNRGFVPSRLDENAPAPAVAAGQAGAAVVVTGLLRMSQPGGGFLRDNDPASERWYSRDVEALAGARGLDAERVAPYFIDAEAEQGSQHPERSQNPATTDYPVAGLTVVSFSNSHLVYAITWYVLALMVAVGTVWLAREELRARRGITPGAPKHPSGSETGGRADSDA